MLRKIMLLGVSASLVLGGISQAGFVSKQQESYTHFSLMSHAHCLVSTQTDMTLMKDIGFAGDSEEAFNHAVNKVKNRLSPDEQILYCAQVQL